MRTSIAEIRLQIQKEVVAVAFRSKTRCCSLSDFLGCGNLKYPEIFATSPSGTPYANEHCYKLWIEHLPAENWASSKIDRNQAQTSSGLDNTGICSVKSKRQISGRTLFRHSLTAIAVAGAAEAHGGFLQTFQVIS